MTKPVLGIPFIVSVTSLACGKETPIWFSKMERDVDMGFGKVGERWGETRWFSRECTCWSCSVGEE